MYDDNNDSADSQLFEVVQSDGPAPMEGIISVTDTTSPVPRDAPASGQDAEDDLYKGSYTWNIENFSQLSSAKELSSKFEVGTHFWRLLVFPRGNAQQPGFLAVYLEFTEASFTPQIMCPKANFKLELINHRDPQQSVNKETSHLFTQNETDWGFTQFHPLADVNDPAKGFLMNDTLTIRVEINVQRDERYTNDYRKQTGCVGLKNQGATCYMNSLLQFLFHIPYFRKAVYHMPTPENEEAKDSMPLALQGLFYKLQYSKSSVSTKALTKSFGWNQHDAFMQHDVQEFNRVLCDKLEEKMKGTKVERAINELFEGHIYNFISCMNVDYKSTRKESFMDLQLDVKGCKDLYASFDKYTETETLEGANQYKAEGYGLQDAQKGSLFESFPPVLQLQLKRFEYDFQRDALVKINDRYEFYDELDLDVGDGKYLAPTADRSVRNLYRLHSVLVHSGGVHGGHYYAFIRPSPDGGWLKFDDEKVTLEEASKALTEQFGGEDDNAAPPMGPQQLNGTQAPNLRFTKYSNAYMLVYVRVSDWDRVMCPVTKEDTADHLRTRLDLELADKEQKQRDKMEAHLYCHLKVATDEDFRKQVGTTRHFDLVDADKVLSLRLKKQTKFSAFKEMVAERLGVPVAQQRYWTWNKRSNGTYRPNILLPRQDEDVDLMDLREHREKGHTTNKAALMDIRLYLETPLKEGAPLAAIPPHTLLVFLKYYDPVTETLSFLTHTFIHQLAKIYDLAPLVCSKVGLPTDTPLIAFEEVKPEPTVMVDELSPETTPQAFDGINGDIIVFQLPPPANKDLRNPTVKEYLEYIRSRRTVEFRKLEQFQETGFKLELRASMTYDEVAEKVAEHIGLADPRCLRFTMHSSYMHHPQKEAIKYRSKPDLEAMLRHGAHLNELLYYEKLDMPLPELEQLKSITLAFYNDKVEQVSTHTLRVPKDHNVEQLLAHLQESLPAEVQGKQLRLLEVYNSRIFKVLPLDYVADGINDGYWGYRAEEGPSHEMGPLEGAGRVVQVVHVKPPREQQPASHLPSSLFGDPFLYTLRDDETLKELKAAIQAKLGVPEEELKKWKVVLTHRSAPNEYLEDEDEVVSHRFDKASSLDQITLGLEHEDKGTKRPPPTPSSTRPNYERPVKIYN